MVAWSPDGRTIAGDLYLGGPSYAGIVLYECLTGRPPFEADTVYALVAKHLEEEPPDPRSYSVAGVPPEIKPDWPVLDGFEQSFHGFFAEARGADKKFIGKGWPTFTPDGTLVIGADDWAYYGITPPRDGKPATLKWRFQTQGTLITSPAVDADGTVYVASMDGSVYALEPPMQAGQPVKVRWTFSSGQRDAEGGFENAAVIDEEGTLYTGGNDGVLYALDTGTGKERWTFDGVARSGYRTYAIFSSVALGPDRTVYFGGKDGILYALQERRGLFGRRAKVLWRYKLGPGIQSSPLLDADGTIYIGDEQGTLHAVRPPAAGGWAEPLWTFHTKGTLISSPALDADGTLYTASMDGKAYAFHDIKKGKSSQDPLSGTWYGTYRDSGGKGRITLVVAQRGQQMQGIWRVQAGAWGSLEGTVDRDRSTFVLQSAVKECPGNGEGSVRIEENRLIGAYRGQDCRGKIEDGKFEVQR